MEVCNLRELPVDDYTEYVRSCVRIRDELAYDFVRQGLDEQTPWPEPLVQFNPGFAVGGTTDELVTDRTLHDAYMVPWNGSLQTASAQSDLGHFLGSLVYVATGDRSTGFIWWPPIDGRTAGSTSDRLKRTSELLSAARRRIQSCVNSCSVKSRHSMTIGGHRVW